MSGREQHESAVRLESREQLEQAIAALEAQRVALGDAVVDTSIAALREKLAALEATPPTDQRRQITVLFADVPGFTTLTETMDAEEVNVLMNALWSRLDEAIISHGGRIDKHMGDGVMALWGADIAREDDPERAVQAALAMQEGLAAFRAEQQMNLTMRIGIHTGPVLLGAVGTTGEYTAMGDTVNLASRLEQAAPVGQILISHAVYYHVRSVFDVQALDPIVVKGKAEPIQVYLVQRGKPRAFRRGTRGVEGVETRMIGREVELRQLQDAFYRAMNPAGSERRIATIIGEAGIGKSRLLYEFENWLELLSEPIHYFKGRASLEMQHQPYALIRDLFSYRFQIQDSDPARVVREKVERGIGGALSEATPEALSEQVEGRSRRDEWQQVKAHVIGHWLGFDFSTSPHLQGVLDDAQQLRDRALVYLREFLQVTTTLAPTVILLEDIHWADDSSLDVIDHLARTVSDERLLIVCLTRPTLFERRPQWAVGWSAHTRLELQPLSERDSRLLVDEILQKAEDVPATLRDLVVGRAEGNPFYVEELVKMLIEDGVIVKGEVRWQVDPTRLPAVRVPSTLIGVLQARLDSLPADEQMVLQQASVVGRAFWDSAVVHIGVAVDEGVSAREVFATLSALGTREMIFRRATSAFAEAHEYIFKHAILRDVTYERVLKRVRRIYHALVAEWLIEQSGERTGEYVGLIADHLELAGQTEQAVTYLRRAGEQAAAQFANAEAVNYLSRALDLTPETDRATRYALLLARERVYDVQGERETQRWDLVALRRLAEDLTDDAQLPALGSRQAEVALRWAYYAEATGDYPAAIAAAQEAIGLSQADQAVGPEVARLQATGYLQWGRVLCRQGDHEAARPWLEQALALARAAQASPGLAEQAVASLRRVEADSLRNLGGVAMNQDDYSGARDYYEQALRICREIGNRRGEGHALISLGIVSYYQGDYAQAGDHYRQALRTYREIGDRRSEAMVLNNLGNVSEDQGDYTQAGDYYQQVLRICREVGDRQIEGLALNNLGVLSDYQGDYARARGYYERALRIYREIGDRWAEGDKLAYLGLLSHHQGDEETARDCCRQSLLIAQDIGASRVQGYALTFLGHALVGLGQLTEAAAAYREALALWRELDQLHLAMESLAGLARVSLAQGDLSQAQARVEKVLRYLDSNSLDGTEEPCRVYLTCYRVLRATSDPRAQAVLNVAHGRLQEQAAKIADEELRRSFLENVAVHREIVRLWEAE